MNFDTFIAGCRTQWPDFDDARKLAVCEHPRDRYLAKLPTEIQGMATENKLMLLNLAVANLAAGEVYIEVGCWRGLTLAGAAFGHPHRYIYACDNFSQFGGSREELNQTVKKYTVPGQVRFYDMDFPRFLDLAPWRSARVGAYFYDGGHSFSEQYKALERILPYLADTAVVIVDDSNGGPVRSANRLFAERVPGLRLVANVRTPGNCSPTWWNGVQIYVYRSGPIQESLPRPGLSYHIRRFFWEDMVPPTQEIIRHSRRIAASIPGLKMLYQRFRQR